MTKRPERDLSQTLAGRQQYPRSTLQPNIAEVTLKEKGSSIEAKPIETRKASSTLRGSVQQPGKQLQSLSTAATAKQNSSQSRFDTTTTVKQSARAQSLGTKSSAKQYASEKPTFSHARLQEIHDLAETRRRERNKGLTRNMEVCDLLDMRNVQSVAEHAPKITNFLLEEEMKFLLPKTFLQDQREVTEKMRAYLVDWLAELHFRFKLWSETLYVTVGIIDRFLAVDLTLKKSELQCLGLTALHIAGKYEEIYPPELKNILKITDEAVPRKEIIEMEFRVLSTLQFSVTFPSMYRFLERFARLA